MSIRTCRLTVCATLCGAAFVTVGRTATAQSAALIGGNQVQRVENQQKQMAAEARQKKMETDAARLVEMAQQLKTSVDKTNKDVLSVDVIKEAERIEKLAREVREGMRQ
ncbi:hypothetical protein [Terriglobus aquaticus]|uniref:Uncharacterized protein n=1 Tax=Terriglobus aquaticus TaxID=940139 RepID=A0ABW9KJD7_9BACT|nr:hypothetical protein [Terriglobus aquaticus]